MQQLSKSDVLFYCTAGKKGAVDSGGEDKFACGGSVQSGTGSSAV